MKIKNWRQEWVLEQSMSGMEAVLSLMKGASVSAGVEDASHMSLMVLGEDAHLRGNSSTMMSIHQEWMGMVIKTHTLLCLLRDAAPAPVLADGMAMRMIWENGECVSCHLKERNGATRRKTDCSWCCGPNTSYVVYGPSNWQCRWLQFGVKRQWLKFRRWPAAVSIICERSDWRRGGSNVSRLWFQCVAIECRFSYVNSYTSHSSTEKRLCVSPCSEWTNVRYTGHHHCNIPAGNWIMAACISCAKRNHTDCVAGLGLSVGKSCFTGPQPC